jgi:hypothetical protein
VLLCLLGVQPPKDQQRQCRLGVGSYRSHHVHLLPAVGAGVVRPDWNGFNMIHESASRVAALDIGFQPSASARAAGPAKVVFLFGADDYQAEDVPEGAFVVYQVSYQGLFTRVLAMSCSARVQADQVACCL